LLARILGSAIVVVVGLVPTIAGGPLYVVLMTVLGLGGYHEFRQMTIPNGQMSLTPAIGSGYLVIALFAVSASFMISAAMLALIVLLAVAFPLALLVSRGEDAGALSTWSLVTAGSLYLGLPVFAAVTLRSLPGPLESSILADLAARLSLAPDVASRGMAWALVAVLVTWIGDSAAYLVGRSIRGPKLAPQVSPGKTISGSIGGLIGSGLTGLATFAVFALGPWWIGLAVGAVIGLSGQVGDLCESFLKRQTGRKDSGAVIPGHGGVLDRIDALLFALPTTLTLALALERLGLA
jgi:phosphatidate cytidylyltransferase